MKTLTKFKFCITARVTRYSENLPLGKKSEVLGNFGGFVHNLSRSSCRHAQNKNVLENALIIKQMKRQTLLVNLYQLVRVVDMV